MEVISILLWFSRKLGIDITSYKVSYYLKEVNMAKREKSQKILSDNLMQFKVVTSTNIATKKISYCITRLSRLNHWVPDSCGVGAKPDPYRNIVEENELPPHDSDLWNGFLFDTYDDAHIAMEKIAERMKEKHGVEAEIISRNSQ
jgi:hypothetical protein